MTGGGRHSLRPVAAACQWHHDASASDHATDHDDDAAGRRLFDIAARRRPVRMSPGTMHGPVGQLPRRSVFGPPFGLGIVFLFYLK